MIHANTRLFSIFSAGVSPLGVGAGSSSYNKEGSMAMTCSPLGCIKALTTTMATMTMPTMRRFCGARMVCPTGTGFCKAPLVISFNPEPGVAIVNGMEPERPACHTTKPL